MLEMKFRSQFVPFDKCFSRQMFPITFQFHCFQFVCVHFFELKKLGQEFLYQRTVNEIVVFFYSNRYFWMLRNEMQSSETFSRTFLFNEMYEITQWNKWNVFTKRYISIAKTVQIIDFL